ncbi:hypothetical protein M8J75_014751 [Diaphorina citri]|nr:hypothetical protein M8J75_014751 [Diaphorina citri]KAI5739734.1 hypothetical protein M8J77_022757 [Diaphorina citri]
MDTKYPESLSRILKQRDRRKLRREEGIAIRHRTQPITFSEIQEVDEENIREEDEARANDEFDSSSSLNMGLQSSKSTHDMSMNARFEQFLLLNYNRPEKKRTKKSLNKLSLSALSRPQSTSQTPEVSPIPASPDSAGTDEGSNPPSGGGLADSFARLLNTPRTSI